MTNPWTLILLEDYENHMNSNEVQQYPVLNKIMNLQLNSYKYKRVIVLGSGGGNGLEYANKDSEIYCVDVNSEFLEETQKRYSDIKNLKTLCLDLRTDFQKLPQADLIIANLLVEYIGYNSFKSIIELVKPKYISCVIQVDSNESFVSESKYIHKFDSLESIHNNIDAKKLTEILNKIGYKKIVEKENILPNKKILLQLDYTKCK